MRYQIRHARVQFGGDVILQDVNFEVHDREKIAIVGRNGCGKTTLLKLIAGDIEMSNPDSDEECGITMAGGQEIGFLRQVNFVDAEVTVEDELKKVFVPVFACEERMKELEEQMKTAAETRRLRRMGRSCASMTDCRSRWRRCGDIPGAGIWRRCSSGLDLHWRICGVRSAVFPEGSRRKWRL